MTDNNPDQERPEIGIRIKTRDNGLIAYLDESWGKHVNLFEIEDAIKEFLFDKFNIEDPELEQRRLYWDCNVLSIEYDVIENHDGNKVELSNLEYIEETVLIDVQRNVRVKQKF